MVIVTSTLAGLGFILGAISLVNPTLLPYHDIFLLVSGVLIGFVSLTFDELFIRSPEREEAARTDRVQIAETTLVRLRNAFHLGRLLELRVRKLAIVEGNLTPPEVKNEEIVELARDLAIEKEVQDILSLADTQGASMTYDLVIGRLRSALARHRSHGVVAAAYAGFYLGSMILPPGSVGIISNLDMEEVIGNLDMSLREALVPQEVVSNVDEQLLRLNQMPGDQEGFSIFSELIMVIFDHLDHDCGASIRVKEFLLTCDATKPEFLSKGREIRDFSREFHKAGFKERMKILSDE